MKMTAWRLFLVFGLGLGLVASLGSTACDNKAFNDSYCASFKDSFIKSCTDACAKNGTREACQTRCTEELPKQSSYARCLAPAASASAK